MATTKQLLEAVSIATKNGFNAPCWWGDTETDKFVNEAVKKGWARRHSVTQVEWTEAGVEVYRAEKAKEYFAAAVALVVFELAKDAIEAVLKYKTDNAYGLDGGGVWVMLYEKKEFWYEINEQGLKPVTDVAGYQNFLAEFNAYIAEKRAQL